MTSTAGLPEFVTPEMARLALEMAVDAAWSAIECHSLKEPGESVCWFALGEDAELLADELRLLEGLGLLKRHPIIAGWVREIAEL